jgi:hypothetical protein
LTLASYCDYSSALKMEAMFSVETSLVFNGLRGILSQKIKLFVTVSILLDRPFCYVFLLDCIAVRSGF